MPSDICPKMICTREKDTPILIFDKVCCFKLRTAVLIIACLEILAACGVVITHAGHWTAHAVQVPGRNNSVNDAQDRDSFITEKPARVDAGSIWPIIGFYTHTLIYIAVSSVLIHGVRKNRTFLMRTWLWVRAVNLVDFMVESMYDMPFSGMITIAHIALYVVSIAAMIIVRSYIFKSSQNEETVQLEEVPEDA